MMKTAVLIFFILGWLSGPLHSSLPPLNGDHKEAFEKGFLYESPLSQKRLWNRPLTRTDAGKMFFKLYQFLGLTLPAKFSQEIEQAPDPKDINRGYREFLVHLETQFPLKGEFENPYISSSHLAKGLKKFLLFMELKWNLCLLNGQDTQKSLYENDPIDFIKHFNKHSPNGAIDVETAGILFLKLGQKIKLEQHKRAANHRGRELYYLDQDQSNLSINSLKTLMENGVLGEKFPRKYTLLPKEGITLGEAYILMGNLISNRGELIPKPENPKKRKNLPWNPSLKLLFQQPLVPAKNQRDPLEPLTRSQCILLAEKVFKFCEIHLGFDARFKKVQHRYQDVSKREELSQSLEYFYTRNIIPFKGKNFNPEKKVKREEILILLGAFLQSCTMI